MLFKGNSSRLEFLIEKIQAHKESPSPLPDEKSSVKSKDGLLSGSYSWRSEEDSFTCQRGGGTPSSCATSASLSFPSETETDGDLRINNDINHSSGPYSCQFCEKAFPSLSCLKKHEQTHGDQMPYRCSWCARLFKHKRSRDRHVKLHTGDRRYRCTHCEAAFSRSDHLKIHMKTHDNQKLYHCTDCSRGYNTAAALTSHMQSHKRPPSRHYQRSLPTASPPASLPDQQTPNLPKIPYLQSPLHLACMYCRDTFATMEQLQLHVHAAHEALFSLSSPSPSPNDPSDCRASKVEELEDLTCRRCSAKFTKLVALRDHLVSAHNDGFSPLTCPLCAKVCASATAYAEHYVLEHCENKEIAPKIKDSQVKKFQETTKTENLSAETLLCGQCGAALKDFESFRAHLAKHLHADQPKPSVNCPNCELKFHEREAMLIHLVQHFTGQVLKKFSCNACEKLFGDSDSLQKHLLGAHAHHLYRCGICRDTFDSIVGIQVHFTIKHTQEAHFYHCNSCRERNDTEDTHCSFRTPGELLEHVKNVHAPENVNSPGNSVSTPGIIASKFLRCCLCGMFCSTESDLQHHLTSHSTCYFKCPICREGFPVEFLLDQHIATAHNLLERPDDSENERKNLLKRRRSPDFNLNHSDKRLINRPNSISISYRCDACNRSEFSSDAELKAHRKLAHKPISTKVQKLSSSFVCSYCGEALRTRLELESHTRVHHAPGDPGKRYKCNICDEVLTSGGLLAEHKLQKHCKIHMSDVCIVCRGVLGSERDFLEHVHMHSLEGEGREGVTSHVPAHCVVCRQTLISEFECQLHAKFHLKNDCSGDRNDEERGSCCICLRKVGEGISLPSKGPGGEGEQGLKVCKRCFLRHSQGLPILRSPYEDCQRDTEEEVSVKLEGEENSSSQDKNESTRPYDCPHCSLGFNFRNELEHHVTTHDSKETSKDTLDSVIVKEEIVMSPDEDQSNEKCEKIQEYNDTTVNNKVD